MLDRYKFTGFIDLLLRNKDTGNIILVDHKSKNGFKSKKELAQYARQLYLYAKHVKEHYGQPPSLLVFNLIRKNTAVQIPYNDKDAQAAIDWAVSTIDNIYAAASFPTKLELNAKRKGLIEQYDKADYFCMNVCDHRDKCEAMNTEE